MQCQELEIGEGRGQREVDKERGSKKCVAASNTSRVSEVCCRGQAVLLLGPTRRSTKRMGLEVPVDRDGDNKKLIQKINYIIFFSFS